MCPALLMHFPKVKILVYLSQYRLHNHKTILSFIMGSIVFKTLLMVLCLVVFALTGCSDGDSESAVPIPPTTPNPILPEDVFDEALWNDPPMENRPYARWWWPGGAVEEDEIQRELSFLKDNYFGGGEMQQ